MVVGECVHDPGCPVFAAPHLALPRPPPSTHTWRVNPLQDEMRGSGCRCPRPSSHWPFSLNFLLLASPPPPAAAASLRGALLLIVFLFAAWLKGRAGQRFCSPFSTGLLIFSSALFPARRAAAPTVLPAAPLCWCPHGAAHNYLARFCRMSESSAAAFLEEGVLHRLSLQAARPCLAVCC